MTNVTLEMIDSNIRLRFVINNGRLSLYSSPMAKLKVGQSAPNMQLQTLEGDFVALESFWGNGRFDRLNTKRSALLIFLRHLA